MRIAIPIAQGQICPHFGHSEQFFLVDVDPESQQILQSTYVSPPPHEPGVIPRWLADQGVEVVLSGGMGRRAQQLFEMYGVKVIVGIAPETPEKILADFLAGTLPSGKNLCDH